MSAFLPTAPLFRQEVAKSERSMNCVSLQQKYTFPVHSLLQILKSHYFDTIQWLLANFGQYWYGS